MKYVIVELGEEYNDEINQISEDGGTLIGVLESRERAEEICKKKNLEKLPGLDIHSYCYGLDDITNLEDDEVEKLMPFLGKVSKYELTVPKNATPEQLELVYEHFSGLRFFKVEEVREME